MSIDRIKELVDQLNKACNAYYVKDNPTMTDKQYDILYSELEHLELTTGYILSSSPTQKVQGEVLPYLQKVQHTEPMLSAEKSKDINDVIKFMGDQDCVLSWKLDGLTIVLRYNKGKLQQAITRGGGEYGEDVTHTVRTFANIPLTIDYKGYLEIRGEGLVPFNEFERINLELVSKGQETYSSPRNLAAGSVRQLDANITKDRNLIFIAFGIVKCDMEISSKYQQFGWLSHLGFDVVENDMVKKSYVKEQIEIFQLQIPQLPYLTDGLIIEFNDIAYGKAQGITGHHPKNIFALKWKDDCSETIFRGVELNTTRTGMVSITGLFDEVDIDGVKVSRASLHNYDIFQALQLGVGDVVTVYRANAVIPQIEDNLTRSNSYHIEMKCPSCGGDVVIKTPKEARFLFCENENCPSKLVNRFVHFCSKDAMNIDGLSDAGIELFINKGFLKTFDDLYKLEQYKSQIVQLEGWGIKSYNKLIQAIEKSKEVKLENFLYALGIGQLGQGGSKRLAKHFNYDINAFMRSTNNPLNFTTIEDFGDVTANSICDYFKKTDNLRLVLDLLQCVSIKKPEEKKEVVNTDNPFSGKKIYCTGTFAGYKKDELKAICEGLGAEFTSGYAKSLDYLVVGSIKGSSKEDKARKDGIKILSEDEFVQMIG